MVAVDAISLATVPIFGYLFALLTRHFAFGLAIPLIFYTAYFMIADNGAAFSYPQNEQFPFWIWATLAAAVFGHAVSRIFDWHPLLDGHWLLYGSSAAEPTKKKRFTKMVAITMLFIILLMLAHIPLEAATDPSWPVWAGGILTSVLLAGVWVLFWALLRWQTPKLDVLPSPDSVDYPTFIRLKDTENPAAEGERAKMYIDELQPFILINALVYILYVTVYWLWRTLQSSATWIPDKWYFYSSLIITGVFALITIPLGIFLSRRSHKRYKEAKARFAATQESEKTGGSSPAPPSEPVTPGKESVEAKAALIQKKISSYISPW